jgi:CSLREA domain-containing protein
MMTGWVIRSRRLVGAALAVVSFVSLSAIDRGEQTSRVLTVDSTADEADVAPGDGTCATSNGRCTLRAAIQEANAAAGPDTILLGAGTYTLTIAGQDEGDAATGDLDIRDTLTIIGAGSAQTIIESAVQPPDRVFEIFGGDVKLAGLTIRNGAAFNVNNQRTEGGGIAHRSGSRLTLVDVAFKDNHAGQGGGLWTVDGTVIIKDAVFDGNIAGAGGLLDHNGGAIYMRDGSLTITTSTFRNNRASAGGALAVKGTARLAETAIVSNAATPFFSPCLGGGIYNEGDLSVTQSLVADNATGNSSGCEGRGAGIWNSGTVALENTTISRNHATDSGGALYNDLSSSPTVSLHNVTVFGNDALTGGGIYNPQATVNIVNTLLGGNVDHAAHGSDCSGTLQSQGHNLIQTASGCTINGEVASNIVGKDPNVGPLADNGGRTATHALVIGSPAIDAGDNGMCPAVDQRSRPRPLDGDGDGTATCDIGAYEVDPTQRNDGIQIARFIFVSRPSRGR